MSASLVGSEMCIRDSIRALSGIFGQFQASPEAARNWPKVFESARKCLTCLLYTSDAADDM
eukprot:992645-Alexandrium_andersonii.AAC.1